MKKKNSVNMNGNGSDSQESNILPEDTFNFLESEMMMSIYPHDLMGEQLDVPEEKYNLQSEEQQLQKIPEYPTAFPATDPFPGEYNFEINLESNTAGKKWLYSAKLEQIFIDMEHTLPLNFQWNPVVPDLFLRTTMAFSSSEYRAEPVKRCNHHVAATNQNNRGIDYVNHVVRCLNPQAVYEADHNGHLSVLVPLGIPQAGTDYVPIHFKFYCKNSCVSGMNRRPTKLIFSLETGNGSVVGRRNLRVRVCSCPKRDKDKLEAEEGGNRNIPGSKRRKRDDRIPPGKRVMQPNPQGVKCSFYVPNEYIRDKVLEGVFNVLAGEASFNDQKDVLRPYMNAISDMRRK